MQYPAGDVTDAMPDPQPGTRVNSTDQASPQGAGAVALGGLYFKKLF